MAIFLKNINDRRVTGHGWIFLVFFDYLADIGTSCFLFNSKVVEIVLLSGNL